MKTKRNDKAKKPLGKKLILYGLATLATGLISYFGFQYWKKNKEESGETEQISESVKQSQTGPKKKAGVTKAKSATKKPGNKTAKPGSGKAAPDENKKAQEASAINATQIAGEIHAAILQKDFSAAFNQLKLIKNVNDYSAVSKVYLKTRTNGKPQTLVSGLLNSFKTDNQKSSLHKAFTAMGLKYNGKKWALSGVDNTQVLITIQPAKVWLDPKSFVQVPPNMVLGPEIAKRGDFSVFENEKRYFLVESSTVKYYEQQ